MISVSGCKGPSFIGTEQSLPVFEFRLLRKISTTAAARRFNVGRVEIRAMTGSERLNAKSQEGKADRSERPRRSEGSQCWSSA